MKASVIGCLWFLLLWVLILIFVALGNPGRGHHGKPTPTPTPTPAPTPVPTPPSVTLAWDPPTDTTGITGYAVWIGFNPGAENQENDLGLVLTISLQLTSGTTYYFIVTSYDSAHTMSVPSNEISYTAP